MCKTTMETRPLVIYNSMIAFLCSGLNSLFIYLPQIKNIFTIPLMEFQKHNVNRKRILTQNDV